VPRQPDPTTRVRKTTGPPQTPFAAAADELAVVTGRRIRHLRVSTKRDAALLSTQDIPEEVVARLTRVLTELLDGRNTRLTPASSARSTPEQRNLVDDKHGVLALGSSSEAPTTVARAFDAPDRCATRRRDLA
jgi:hypothetical protein